METDYLREPAALSGHGVCVSGWQADQDETAQAGLSTLHPCLTAVTAAEVWSTC